jgi:hypothetical protein
VDPVPDPTTFFSGSSRNRTQASGSVTKNSDHSTTEAVLLKGLQDVISTNLSPARPTRRYIPEPQSCKAYKTLYHRTSVLQGLQDVISPNLSPARPTRRYIHKPQSCNAYKTLYPRTSVLQGLQDVISTNLSPARPTRRYIPEPHPA